EKDGTVTNSDRTISRQRAALPPPGQARPDWAILAETGRRMGWAKAFDYQSPAEIFREHAALSGIAGRFGRDFDISGLAALDDAGYAGFEPTRWPVNAAKQGGRFFAGGGFFHPDGRARFIPVTHRAPAARTEPRFPFRLNTGRVRDQWHTMTRTGLSPRLSAHLAEPFLDIHPTDADRLGLRPADLARVSSPTGSAILRVRITDAVQTGQLFAPMHWTGETAPSARIDALIAGATDPVSGQPESKAAVVAVERFPAAWYGFAVSSGEMSPTPDYWALARTTGGSRAELAGVQAPGDWETAARALFALPAAEAVSVTDPKRGIARIAFHRNGRLLAALFVAPEPVAVMRDYLATLPGTEAAAILTGRTPADVPDPGPVICSCFGIGLNTLIDAIESRGLASVDAIGAALRAGTNCGSCRPELADLLARARVPEAAE
ncbi:MAG: (2Fe-2S)-binding protein, partial [Pseudooceanicola sp.]|nr:(2Fe-2S)-binding protein [Pseudooceanicola sp.]